MRLKAALEKIKKALDLELALGFDRFNVSFFKDNIIKHSF